MTATPDYAALATRLAASATDYAGEQRPDDAIAKLECAHVRAAADALYALAATPNTPPPLPDAVRGPLLAVLYNHQGGKSPIGQPIRQALGIGQCDALSDADIALAKQHLPSRETRQRPRPK